MCSLIAHVEDGKVVRVLVFAEGEAAHAAEAAGTLQRYKGAKGKAVWKAADLDKVLESIQPTEIIHRQPPQKSKKAGKAK